MLDKNRFYFGAEVSETSKRCLPLTIPYLPLIVCFVSRFAPSKQPTSLFLTNSRQQISAINGKQVAIQEQYSKEVNSKDGEW